MIQHKPLQTKRLRLHTLNQNHVGIVLEFYKRNKEAFRPWLPAYHEDFFTLDFQQKRLALEASEMEAGRLQRWYIFSKKDTQNKHLLGVVTCSNIVRGVFQSCFLGYMIDQKLQNKGLATEALERVIRFAFQDLNLHRLEANIMPRNLPSIRVAKKLGFVQEGLSKKYLKINGEWEDHLRFALLA